MPYLSQFINVHLRSFPVLESRVGGVVLLAEDDAEPAAEDVADGAAGGWRAGLQGGQVEGLKIEMN